MSDTCLQIQSSLVSREILKDPFNRSTQRDGVGFVRRVRDSSNQFMNGLFPPSKERHLVPENVSIVHIHYWRISRFVYFAPNNSKSERM